MQAPENPCIDSSILSLGISVFRGLANSRLTTFFCPVTLSPLFIFFPSIRGPQLSLYDDEKYWMDMAKGRGFLARRLSIASKKNNSKTA
jgi:hypothetical protein